MAPLRTAQARTRPRRNLLKEIEDPDRDELSAFIDDEPPLKRMRTSRSAQKSKWIPGGRGGGGRHIEPDDADVLALTPKAEPFSRARSRTSRPANKKMVSTPRVSARSRNRGATRPRYSTAAAATAAAAHGDGYKPREERGWEEFHPDLDLDADFAVILSEEVDGRVKKPLLGESGDDTLVDADDYGSAYGTSTPSRKRPGRPPRRTDSMLQALLTPEAPKFVPPPGPNPRERLTLPKPSFRELDPFTTYESKDVAQLDFVDKSMANVGYQESEVFLRPERFMIRQTETSADEDLDISPDLIVHGENSAIGGSGVGRVEYDMDEQDVKWLESFNKIRTKDGVGAIKPAIFEITMTKVEKEWHALEKRIPKPNPKAPQTQRPRSSSAAAVNGEPAGEEGDTKCAICDDGDCENANAIVFCDGCDLAVHQECYGVPYIPEGQWLCRKCQLVGNSRPSCIFCPHEGGAFKQTNNSKWAHLFCAIWVPEVQIGNPSLMEPITDVEKVPHSRWKLVCYICSQAMGASIQCSDGRCFRPFHLTCARQAGLYLQMKSGGGQNTLMEPSQLRAYCHQHSPADWRADHNTDRAHETTMRYCKEHFRGQVWADSRASALAINDNVNTPSADKGPLKVTLTNKKGQKQKTIWRLPSGAPVIPETILKSIEEALVRFTVAKKKEYVSEICKYWTLKREARRGAALLKRLQLQMDTFSSFEVTRRDYKAHGAAGRARLDRRIDFAETLAQDLERIQYICELVKEREAQKLEEARLLKNLIDIVYFPIPALLEPIIDKALKHDRGLYRHGLLDLKARVMAGHFTAISSFSADLVLVFAETLESDATTFAEMVQQVSGRAEDMSSEQRDRRALARRVLKAVQVPLEDALRKEAELTGRPFAQQMKELDEALQSRRGSLAESATEDLLPALVESVEEPLVNGINGHAEEDVEMQDVDEADATGVEQQQNGGAEVVAADLTSQGLDASTVATKNGQATDTPPPSTNGIHPPVIGSHNIISTADPTQALEPPTPPMSLENQSQSQMQIGQGGIPWYVEAFDPDGTSIYDERWTGQQVLREMSEELSEMDEDELTGLDTMGVDAELAEGLLMNGVEEERRSGGAVGKKGKKGRGNDWGGKSFRQRRWR